MNVLIKLLFFVFVLFSFGTEIVDSGHPGYREVRLTRRKIPLRPIPDRFRGEVYSDGSVGWLVSRRDRNGRWSNWIPVSPSRVPPHLVREMNLRLRNRIKPQRPQRGFGASPSDFLEEEISPGSPEVELPIGGTSGRQFTWEEEGEGKEFLDLQAVSPVPHTQRRSYNLQTRTQPIAQRRITTRRVGAPSYPEPLGDEEDLAMYFEEQNTPPLAGKPGLGKKVTSLFKGPGIGLELPSPTFGEETRGFLPSPKVLRPHVASVPTGLSGKLQQPSNYDLGRMQWKFFFSNYKPQFDNLRIVKPVPPLGMKLSKTVSECAANIYKAFQLHFVTISGMTYSKKIKRQVNNSINREIRQWCNGMMTSWYQQLRKMGLIVPKTTKFTR
ncbi:putative secreted protein [Cryptosporidium felis]|nr:putative secreted protein [Cryptosporidium felis]